MMSREAVDLLRGIFWLCVLIIALCFACERADALDADELTAYRMLGNIAEVVLVKANLPCPEGVRLVSLVKGEDFTLKVTCGPLGDFRYTYVVRAVADHHYTVAVWAGP